MNSKDNMKQLQRIEKVKAPDYLYHRIHARIDVEKKDEISPSWVFSLAAAIALLALFNVLHLQNDASQFSNDLASEVSANMNLMPTNQLYHE